MFWPKRWIWCCAALVRLISWDVRTSWFFATLVSTHCALILRKWASKLQSVREGKTHLYWRRIGSRKRWASTCSSKGCQALASDLPLNPVNNYKEASGSRNLSPFLLRLFFALQTSSTFKSIYLGWSFNSHSLFNKKTRLWNSTRCRHSTFYQQQVLQWFQFQLWKNSWHRLSWTPNIMIC